MITRGGDRGVKRGWGGVQEVWMAMAWPSRGGSEDQDEKLPESGGALASQPPAKIHTTRNQFHSPRLELHHLIIQTHFTHWWMFYNNFYQGSLQDYSRKKNEWYQKNVTYASLYLRILNEISGWFVIYNFWWSRYHGQKSQRFYHIWYFNKEHIIKPYNLTQYNIPEEEHYISCMTPTGFINGQDESRWYVNSSFQVDFF